MQLYDVLLAPITRAQVCKGLGENPGDSMSCYVIDVNVMEGIRYIFGAPRFLDSAYKLGQCWNVERSAVPLCSTEWLHHRRANPLGEI